MFPIFLGYPVLSFLSILCSVDSTRTNGKPKITFRNSGQCKALDIKFEKDLMFPKHRQKNLPNKLRFFLSNGV